MYASNMPSRPQQEAMWTDSCMRAFDVPDESCEMPLWVLLFKERLCTAYRTSFGVGPRSVRIVLLISYQQWFDLKSRDVR